MAGQVNTLSQSGLKAEIAFFGGSFTAVDKDYRRALLYAASEYVKEFPEQYAGIRCSTRPDCIDENILEELMLYGVTAVELGAQSMNDEVLEANLRGHTAEDVRRASRLIKSFGIELGLQMMTGLYKDKPSYCIETAREFAGLKADTVRIYPTVILKGTMLDDLRKQGLYESFSFEETVDLCAELLLFFEEKNIPVIRLGLHASEGVEEQMIKLDGKRFIVYTDRKNIGKVVGHGGQNKALLSEEGITFKIKEKTGVYLEIKTVL